MASTDDVVILDEIRAACARGDLNAAADLVQRRGVSPKALSCAVTPWRLLQRDGRLHPLPAGALPVTALGAACAGGHLDVAHWLADVVGVDVHASAALDVDAITSRDGLLWLLTRVRDDKLAQTLAQG